MATYSELVQETSRQLSVIFDRALDKQPLRIGVTEVYNIPHNEDVPGKVIWGATKETCQQRNMRSDDDVIYVAYSHRQALTEEERGKCPIEVLDVPVTYTMSTAEAPHQAELRNAGRGLE